MLLGMWCWNLKKNDQTYFFEFCRQLKKLSWSVVAILNFGKTLKMSPAHLHIVGNETVKFEYFLTLSFRVFAPTKISELTSGGHFEFRSVILEIIDFRKIWTKFRGRKFEILHFMPQKQCGRRVPLCIKISFFAEQGMLLLCKRIFTHPSIFTFNNGMNVSGTKLLKLSELIQITIKNVNGYKCCNYTVCLLFLVIMYNFCIYLTYSVTRLGE